MSIYNHSLIKGKINYIESDLLRRFTDAACWNTNATRHQLYCYVIFNLWFILLCSKEKKLMINLNICAIYPAIVWWDLCCFCGRGLHKQKHLYFPTQRPISDKLCYNFDKVQFFTLIYATLITFDIFEEIFHYIIFVCQFCNCKVSIINNLLI